MTKIKFEMTECKRCGGSGHYSFNFRDGTRCYGCGGTGKRHTAAGLRAHRAYDEALACAFGVDLEDLVPGDVVRTEITVVAGDRVATKRGWFKVAAVSCSVDRRHVAVEYEGHGKTAEWRGTKKVLRRWTADEWRAVVVPKMRRFKGATVVEE